MPTKADLIAQRDATYREPEKCCGNCDFSTADNSQCFVNLNDPGKFIWPQGVCEIWEQKPRKEST